MEPPPHAGFNSLIDSDHGPISQHHICLKVSGCRGYKVVGIPAPAGRGCENSRRMVDDTLFIASDLVVPNKQRKKFEGSLKGLRRTVVGLKKLWRQTASLTAPCSGLRHEAGEISHLIDQLRSWWRKQRELPSVPCAIKCTFR